MPSSSLDSLGKLLTAPQPLTLGDLGIDVEHLGALSGTMQALKVGPRPPLLAL